MNRILKIVTVIFLLLLTGCDVEQKEDIVIVYTTDVAAEVNGEIGYAGLKGYVDSLRKENRYVSIVDCGDFLDGQLAKVENGEAIIKIMNAVGYDVVTLGNQEFAMGLDTLSSAISKSSFKYVSCNIRYLGTGRNPLSRVKPYVIKRYGFTKVAFIGVTTPETILMGNKPAYNAIMDGDRPLYYFYEDDDREVFYSHIQKTIDKVRKKADYVILLAHLGSNSTVEGFSSYDVINNTTGLDVVIDGHAHTALSGEAVPDKEGKIVGLTSTGEKLQNIGVLTLHPDHSFNTVLYPSVYEKDMEVQLLIDSLFD